MYAQLIEKLPTVRGSEFHSEHGKKPGIAVSASDLLIGVRDRKSEI